VSPGLYLPFRHATLESRFRTWTRDRDGSDVNEASVAKGIGISGDYFMRDPSNKRHPRYTKHTQYGRHPGLLTDNRA
jgi:hypothetical protein